MRSESRYQVLMPGSLPVSRVGGAGNDTPRSRPHRGDMMSYWSLRRVAERAAAGHELDRTDDGSMVPATRPATHDAFAVELVRPVVQPNPVTITTPRRSLRER